MQNNFEITSDFSLYKDLFLLENSKHNLISKNDEKFLYAKHIYDSLSLKLFLKKYNISAGSILDIGCGGGFPCVPLAIELKNFNITGVDSIKKKIESINSIKSNLSLDNLTLISARVESLTQKYDIIVSRAVADVKKLCEYAFPLMKKDSYLVLYKSKKVLEELDSAETYINNNGRKIIDIIKYNLPLEDIYERNLVVIK